MNKLEGCVSVTWDGLPGAQATTKNISLLYHEKATINCLSINRNTIHRRIISKKKQKTFMFMDETVYLTHTAHTRN